MNEVRKAHIARLELAVAELEEGLSEFVGQKSKAERLAHNGRLRQARLRLARKKGRHTPAEWEAIVAETGGICVKCGHDHFAVGEQPVKGHAVPIAMGGSDGIDNLHPLCRSCMAAATSDVNYLTEWRKAQLP